MRLHPRLLALFLILTTTLVLADTAAGPLLLQSRFELRLVDPALPLQVRREVTAEATVQLFLELYRKAGPRVGCRLIEPAVILTISGARGITTWNGRWYRNTAEDLARLEELDRFLVPQGISLQPERGFLERGAGVTVTHLAGVERVSRRSRMAGTIPFDASSGWKGYYAWRQEQMQAYEQRGPVRQEAVHVLYGLLLGYPDRAVVGYMGSGRTRNERCISCRIPYASQYECGVPECSFLPADLDDPGIVAHISEWGSLLRAVYEHPEMRRLDADPDFRHARRVALLSEPPSRSTGWWSDERGRLGIWTQARWKQVRESRNEPTDRHERVLRACETQLVRALQERQPNEALLAICRQEAAARSLDCSFGVGTIRVWIGRGSLEKDGPARRLYEAAQVGRPDLLPMHPR